jgi:hypothetical protein
MADRNALLARWTELTRRTLPAMAERERWPIRLDHCFMRVCLDVAIGDRWDRIVARPAIRNLTDTQLARAVATAERIMAEPNLLPGLNETSLRMRRHGAAAQSRPLAIASRSTRSTRAL